MVSLYVIATPIGNLEDITLRALRVLREVDFILCEDTRVTKKLLVKYEIKTPAISYHQHSAAPKVEKIIELLKQGKNLALVTDAGTPGISDPGNKLIAELTEVSRDPSLQVIPVPGPSALTAALSISGLPTDEFLFLGFLPHKKGRQTLVKKIVASERTVVVCRELTKMFESVYRGTPSTVLATLQSDQNNLKGEFVIVIGK